MSHDIETAARSIVLVDDNRPDRVLFREAVHEFDPEQTVTEMPSAEALLQALDEASLEAPPAFFLIDIALPGISGLTLTTELRKRSDTRDVPIVIFSGTEEPLVIERAYAVGANSFLIKPDRYSELRETAAILVRYWRGLNRSAGVDR